MGSAAEDWLTIESHKRYGGRVLVRFGRSDRGVGKIMCLNGFRTGA